MQFTSDVTKSYQLLTPPLSAWPSEECVDRALPIGVQPAQADALGPSAPADSQSTEVLDLEAAARAIVAAVTTAASAQQALAPAPAPAPATTTTIILDDPEDKELEVKQTPTISTKRRIQAKEAGQKKKKKKTSNVSKDKTKAAASEPGDTDGSHAAVDVPDGGHTSDEVVEVLRRTKACNRDSRRDDINTVYTAGQRTINGNLTDGHYCTICRDTLRLPLKECFLKSKSTTSLRNHIARSKMHFPVYKERCREKEIEINTTCIPKDYEQKCGVQRTLDTHVVTQKEWSRSGLTRALVKWVVQNDQSLYVVEDQGFRDVLMYQRPITKESDILKADSLRNAVLRMYEEYRSALVKVFESNTSLISFTFDAGTSRAYDPFLVVVAHWVDEDFVGHERIIGFRKIIGNHCGSNLASILIDVFKFFGIFDVKKLGWGVADNATSCDRAMKYIQSSLDKYGVEWDAVKRRGRCMEHAIHCAVRAFIQTLDPTPAAKIKTILVDKYQESLLEGEEGEGLNGPEEPEEAVEYITGDILGKILALIEQIRASPQARAFFLSCCKEEAIEALELKRWVRTRWASLFDLLERILKVQKAVNRFCEDADESDEVPTLQGSKSYTMYRLTTKEWRLAALIRDAMAPPSKACHTFSAGTTPTVYRALPTLEQIREKWLKIKKETENKEIQEAIDYGLKNIDKWYRKLDDTDIYFICLALNPRFKLVYAEQNWPIEHFAKGKASFEAAFDKYFNKTSDMSAEENRMKSLPPSQVTEEDDFGAGAWMEHKLQERLQRDQADSGPRSELNTYINGPLVFGCTSILTWWRDHKIQFPTLACMARDYLAVPGSSTSSERAFSSARHINTEFRSRLGPDTFEALQILKSAYKASARTPADNILDN